VRSKGSASRASSRSHQEVKRLGLRTASFWSAPAKDASESGLSVYDAGMLGEGERIAKVLSSLDREADITERTRNSHTHSVVKVGQGSGMTCVWVCAGREDKFVERGTVA